MKKIIVILSLLLTLVCCGGGGSGSAGSAAINKVWYTLGFDPEGRMPCLLVHIDLSANVNANDGLIVRAFPLINGKSMKCDYASSNYQHDGVICSSEEINSSSPNIRYEDFVLYIPTVYYEVDDSEVSCKIQILKKNAASSHNTGNLLAEYVTLTVGANKGVQSSGSASAGSGRCSSPTIIYTPVPSGMSTNTHTTPNYNTRVTCTSCGGSGVCSGCNGRRGKYQDVGYYIGEERLEWINCGSCNGTGRCPICHGRGTL